MKVLVYGNEDENTTKELHERINLSVEELGLSDFIELSITNDETLKNELSLTKTPALVIVEESIDFKDVIFEGIVPEVDELKSMFISIIGGGESSGGGCGSGGCGSGCSC